MWVIVRLFTTALLIVILDTPIQSDYDSDVASTRRQTRRLNISPSPSFRDSDSYTYTEEDSMHDAAEVEAALTMIDDELEDTLEQWSRAPSSVTPSYTSYSGTGPASMVDSGASHLSSRVSTDYRTAADTLLDRERKVLSTISEHTESKSRPTSFAQSGSAPESRPISQHSAEGNQQAGQSAAAASPAIHARSSTEPNEATPTTGRVLPPVPGKRAGELIAFFEANTGTPPTPGHTRTTSAPSGPRSPSPYSTTLSRSFPTTGYTATTTGYGYGSTTGYGSTAGYGSTTGYGYSSRPSSPTKSRSGSSVSSSGPISTMSSILSPGARMSASLLTDSRTPTGTFTTTQTSGTRTGTGMGTTTDPSTDTYTRTFTSSSLYSTSATPTTTSLRRPQTSPRSPLTSVRNIVAAWKERTPSLGNKSARSNTTSPSPTRGDGLFSIRRRADRGAIRLRDRALKSPQGGRKPGEPSQREAQGRIGGRSGRGSLSTSELMPPPFDLDELDKYANTKGTQEPLRIGLLWYLNVHTDPPYRWQRCQALLYPHMLLLSWIAPGGGRGVVTLDLLNCTEVRSVPSPMHPSAREDVGTIAALEQSASARDADGGALGELGLAETLCPFQLLYSDGVERLGAESARERVRWVSAIWEVLDRAVSIPDRSSTRSPTGSIRTIRSMSSDMSSRSASASGSATTTYMPPLDIIPDLSDIYSMSGTSTRSGVSRRPSLASAHHTRATDDAAVSNQGYLYPGDPRVIAPSRSSSLRRTSSLTDLDAEFASALRRARESRPGLGFGLGLARDFPVGDAAPVTVSSGPRLGRDVYMSPPPSVGKGSEKTRSRASSSVSVSDDAFFTAPSASNGSRTQTSSFYSSAPFTEALPTTSYDTSDAHPTTGDMGTLESYSRTTITSTSQPYTEDSRTYSSYTSRSRSRSGTDRLSTLDSYTSSGRSYTPTPSSSSYTRSTEGSGTDIPRTVTSTQSSEYVTAKSPSIASFESLPTIPSLSDYETAEVCSTEYETAEKCPTEPTTEYETAEVCPTEPSTEYVTATVCSTEVSTEYDTAECRCAQAPETPRSIERGIEPEEDVESIAAPSEIPTIPSSVTGDEEEEEIPPQDIPLPSSTYSPSEPSTELLETFSSPLVPPTPSPYVPSEDLSESMSIPDPSPIPPSSDVSPEMSFSISTVTSPTESSVTPTPSSQLTLTVPSTIEPSLTPSSPAIPESLWGAESDESYESSLLRASPSVQSLALPDGPDTSFETSFLRPSGTMSSPGMTLLTPISEISTASSITIPSSPSSSLTPTPSSVSLPPSVPSPTPEPTERDVAPLTRTPSSVSTASSASMSSSIFYPRSLMDVPTIEVEPSTEPSLLSTEYDPMATPRAPSHRSVSPRAIPLPPSPSPTAPSLVPPSVSMSVSLSTPRGDAPSIVSQLDTIPSDAPSHIITHDVNRLLQYLHEMNGVRGEELRDISDNLQSVLDAVNDLADDIRQRPREVPDIPPPVPQKDRSVGDSSIMSSRRSTAAGPRELVEPIRLQVPAVPRAISLSPPPSRLYSPDTLSDSESFLSSHHSDDLSLMESEIYPPPPPPPRAISPSWPSDSSSSPESSPTASSVSRGLSDRTPSPLPVPPPLSPSGSSSSASSGTVRPVVPINLNGLRDSVDTLRDMMDAMLRNQDATNQTLNELQGRRDLNDKLQRIEDAVQRLLDAAQQPREPPPPEDVSESMYPSESDTSSLLARLARLGERRAEMPMPQILQPTPIRAGPSFDEQLAELMSTGPPPPAPPPAQPPAITPLRYRPGARAARPRSASPILETDFVPRPGPSPAPRPIRIIRPPAPAGPPRQFPSRPRDEADFAPPPGVFPGGPGGVPASAQSGPEDDYLADTAGTGRRPPSFLRAVREGRMGRDPENPDGFFRSRPTTAPGRLADEPVAPSQEGFIPPPPVIPQGPPPAPPPGTFVPPAPTILQLPAAWDDILQLLRANRDAQLASFDQQRETTRYLRSLNEWLERDVHDRHAEIRGVSARIDQLRDEILNELGRREGGGPPVMLAPGAQPPVIPPPGIAAPGSGLPPGFVPQDAPHMIPIRQSPWPERGTPSPPFTPVIPGGRIPFSPPVIPHPFPEPDLRGGPPVIPPVMPGAGIPGPGQFGPMPVQQPFLMRDDTQVIPPSLTPSDSGSSSSDGRYPEDQDRDRIMVIPPPGGQLPMPVPQVVVQPPGEAATMVPLPASGPSEGLPPRHPSDDYADQPRDHSPRRSPRRSPPPDVAREEVPSAAAPLAPSGPAPGTPRHPDLQPAQQPVIITQPSQPPGFEQPAAPGAPFPITVLPPQQQMPYGYQPGMPMPEPGITPPGPPGYGPEQQQPTTIVIGGRSSRSSSRSRSRPSRRTPSRRPSSRSEREEPREPYVAPVSRTHRTESPPIQHVPIVVQPGQQPLPPMVAVPPTVPPYAQERGRSRSPSPIIIRTGDSRSHSPPIIIHRSPPGTHRSGTFRRSPSDDRPHIIRLEGSPRPSRNPHVQEDAVQATAIARNPIADPHVQEGAAQATTIARNLHSYIACRGHLRDLIEILVAVAQARDDLSALKKIPIVRGDRRAHDDLLVLKPIMSPIVIRRDRSPGIGSPERQPTIIHVRSPSPTRSRLTRRPSQVTIRPSYPEEDVGEHGEPVPISRTRSGVSDMHRAYAADRHTPGASVSRVPTRRSIPEAEYEVPSHPGEEYAESHAPTYPPTEVHAPLEPEHAIQVHAPAEAPAAYPPGTIPTVSRQPTLPGAPSYPPTEGLPPRSRDYAEAEVPGAVPRDLTEAEVPGAIPRDYAQAEVPGVPRRDYVEDEVPVPPRSEALPVPEPYGRPAVPRGVPREVVPAARLSGPGDLGFADAERERHERFGEMERQLANTLDTLEGAEERRDQDFREHEDERERIFLENERRRDQEANERREIAWREFEQRLAEICPPPPPVPPEEPIPDVTHAEVPTEPEMLDVGAPVEALVPPSEAALPVPAPAPATPSDVGPNMDTASIIEGMRTVAQDAQSQHSREIAEIVALERQEMMRQIEAEREEARRVAEEAAAERARQNEEHLSRVAALEEELSRVRGELENERSMRATEESERRERDRAELIERDEAVREQLSGITSIVSEQRDELANKREVMEERWSAKQQWREEDNARNSELRQMVQQILDERAQERDRMEQERAANAELPTNQHILDELQRMKIEQLDTIKAMRDAWAEECKKYHDDTVAQVKATANEQVPFNVRGYLDEFSRSLASEVRMLLNEVGKLREEKRNLEYQLGCLMCMKAKYGPGGEFDPDWRPSTGPCATAPEAAAPEAPAPPPEEPPAPARPGWRTVPRMRGRGRRSQSAAPEMPPAPAPAPPPPQPRPPVASWATWQIDPQHAPSPPEGGITPTLLVPEQPSPGLFGPRSPRGSIHR
ncbi:hypothetical protein CERSUDRAFT_95250 [Gelatoporia subvermispora B]|uniref:PH domain-containing protein n=1 Tax=Ceriporiopsis subvermispora (strain B) TaxID=914234 RepID=M2REW5_CERS8|nr:hypothetical protein CERSUDRAFT_95250 [Gelatoporia subvermispora B]